MATNVTSAWEAWFVDVLAGDLHLLDAFPVVVDQGIDLLADVAVDIDQTSRPQGNGFDIGAHEFPIPSSLTPVPDVTPISLFPNPTRGSFTIQSNTTDPVQLIITDVLGRELVNKKVVSMSQGFQVDTYDWMPGIFTCRIIQENGQETAKQVTVLEE